MVTALYEAFNQLKCTIQLNQSLVAAEVLVNVVLVASRERNRVFPAQEAMDYQLIIARWQMKAAVRLPIVVFPRCRPTLSSSRLQDQKCYLMSSH